MAVQTFAVYPVTNSIALALENKLSLAINRYIITSLLQMWNAKGQVVSAGARI